MSKVSKAPEATTEEEAFEIIELAIDDLQTLTRAFNLIAEVCEAGEDDSEDEFELDKPPHKILLN